MANEGNHKATIIGLLAATLAFATFGAFADTGVDVPATATTGMEAVDAAETPRDAVPQRLRQPVSKVTDLSETTMLAPIPGDAVGIGPGSPMLQTIPGEGTFICTANFVFESGGNFYLGAAGHCFLPADEVSTHGTSDNYDASGVIVEVCVARCIFGGQLTGFLGDMEELGDVAYARQTDGGEDIGHDFGVVAIPSGLEHLIRPEMPMWGGPIGQDSTEVTGEMVVHYGNGIDSGTFFATKGRTGVVVRDTPPESWQASIQINGGDSGSAINYGLLTTDTDVLHGTKALGIITHGLIVPGVPLGWGTTIGQAISMASEAGLSLTMLEEGDVV